MDISQLIPTFGNLGYTVLALVVALSIIVAVHEYGHYIVGRWTGIYAEVFSIGFGPVLISKVDHRGTRWQIAAIPLGGYVKFLGDGNAASKPDAQALAKMDSETKRHTMMGAPVWARALTAAAGPAFNFALSFVIFTAFMFIRGVPIDPPTVGILANLPAGETELLPGDEISSIGGSPTPDYQAFYEALPDISPNEPVAYEILRDGVEMTVVGGYPFPPLVEQVQPESAAMDADLRSGDVVMAINGQRIHAFLELQELVRGSNGDEVTLEVWRAGERIELVLQPRRVDLPDGNGGFSTNWMIGMTGGLLFEPATRVPSIAEASGLATSQIAFIMESSVSAVYHVAVGSISKCNVGGVIRIAKTSSAAASQGIGTFIWFVSVLSTAIGLINLFPIPVLDGGHLVFHAYEAVFRKPPNEKVLNALFAIGLTVVVSLMVFGLANDLFCP